MKRRDSSKSVLSVKDDSAASDLNSTDADTATSTQEKRKRFGRKKKSVGVVDLAVVAGGESAAAVAVPDTKRKKRKGRKGKKQRAAEASEESGDKQKKKRKLGRRRTKRDYTYADDGDILGLVQIEVKGAKDLPRFKNAIRMGYDMDAFAVISFGRKVFRTR